VQQDKLLVQISADFVTTLYSTYTSACVGDIIDGLFSTSVDNSQCVKLVYDADG